MQIDEIIIGELFASFGVVLVSKQRNGAVLNCEGDGVIVNRVLIEFTNEEKAIEFDKLIDVDTASLCIDDNAGPGEEGNPAEAGVKHVAVVDEHGASVYGFTGDEDAARLWMKANKFKFGRGSLTVD